MSLNVRRHLLAGQVIPAHPLALTPTRELDERHQRALTRYYVASGAGGIAVGVHTTQFAIHAPQVGLYRPVLELAAETARAALAREAAGGAARDFALVAGIVGDTRQAVHEAEVARALGYHAGLLSLAAMGDADDAALVRHARAVAEVLPVFGFYLQPAVGGRTLGHRFWRDLAELPNLVAIKVAPFDRYRSFDVVRAVAEAGRDDVALYTGNDDSIVVDLLTPFPVQAGGGRVLRRMVGGLLGQWAVWTRAAVEMLAELKRAVGAPALDPAWLARAAALTDANGAIFDAHHGYAGCLPGIHEVLRRQGLMRGVWTLEPHERLSPGQSEELDRVLRSYPELTDDEFVAEYRDEWLAP
ncbi:dihydrodipicolinate synthase family protein [Roseisolibacter sp. H3M3-2]|uniref:dihydrodipicolinate synthase family protein n=1 Tax=Roseisolibacter sp. H3M3-2 TaxID=3031323 RepID=UPI0023DB012B|nr:dihydrodipicolinate synthase family protein [Roseisolibacter sp. H3M3-2]MDF1504711.1 dihydrodipicolinate synthase family protein [Roseisolibacter sp. H3M3-2]